jgi:hypothetical protein
MPVSFTPKSLSFSGVLPNSAGPDISIDPSLPADAVSFQGGVQIASAPNTTNVTAHIQGNDGIFKVRDLLILQFVLRDVDPNELPHGHHGPLPKERVLELVSQGDGSQPLPVKKGQFVLTRVKYAAPGSGNVLSGTLVIQGDGWETVQVPLSLFVAEVVTTFGETLLTIHQGQQVNLPITVRSVAGPEIDVRYRSSPLQLHTGISLTPTTVHVQQGQALSVNLTLKAEPDAPLGENTIFIEQVDFASKGLLLPVNVIPASLVDMRSQSDSYVFRVEHVTIDFQRAELDSVDDDVLQIFVKVDDAPIIAHTFRLYTQATTGVEIPTGRFTQTIPIQCDPTSIVSVSYVITNIRRPDVDDAAQYEKILKIASQVVGALATIASSGVIGIIASAFDKAATALGLIDPASPDCSGRSFTQSEVYQGAGLARLTQNWATHRPPPITSMPIDVPSACGRPPDATVSIAFERVPPTIAAVALTLGKIEVIATTPSGSPQIRVFDAWNPPGPGPWVDLGGGVIGTPAAVSVVDEIATYITDIFAVAPDQTIWTKRRNANGWHPSQTSWQPFGGIANGSVVATTNGLERTDLFVIGTDATLYQRTRVNESWSDWVQIRALVGDDPDPFPVENLSGNISVNFSYFPFPKVVIYAASLPEGGYLPANFDHTRGRTLVRIDYDRAEGWRAHHAHDEHGASRLLNDAVTAVPDTSGDTEAFAVLASGGVATTLGANPNPYPPFPRVTLGGIGGVVISRVAVVQFTIDKFPEASGFQFELGYMAVAVGTNREVYFKIGNATGMLTWYPDDSQWESIGGQAIGDPVVVAYEGVRRIFVFVVGTDERVYWKYYERPDQYVGGTKTGTWHPSQRGWNRLD